MAAQARESYQLYKRYVKNIAQIYNSRKDIRAYIELMLSISVVVIFGIFAIRPTLVTIAQLQKEIEEREKTLEELNLKMRSLEMAQEEVTKYARTLPLVDTAVPDGPLPVLYARQIEGLTRKNNTTLFGLGVDNVVIVGEKTNNVELLVDPNDRYPTDADSMEFSINVRGEYENILGFINDIEKLRRPILIDKLSIIVDEDEEQNRLILSVLGRVPFLK